MTWLLATFLLALAAPFVLWPLIRHLEPEADTRSEADASELRSRRLEEIDLDLASGRLDRPEAERLRRELGP